MFQRSAPRCRQRNSLGKRHRDNRGNWARLRDQRLRATSGSNATLAFVALDSALALVMKYSRWLILGLLLAAPVALTLIYTREFLCRAFAANIYSASAPSSSQQFQTSASFSLAVQKSKVLKLGNSRLATTSAFVTYTDEFFAGKTNALKVQFFTQPITEDTRAKLLRNDNNEMSRGGYAALVLFLDERNQIWQANLTYVIPGTTVVRTVASSREELAKYFSDYRFEQNRLRLKSKGTYNTATDSTEEILTLSWETDLDLPVFDQIKK